MKTTDKIKAAKVRQDLNKKDLNHEYTVLSYNNAARMAELLERAVEILKDEEDDVWRKEVRALFLSDFQKFQDGENV